jgi:hypothetical protein
VKAPATRPPAPAWQPRRQFPRREPPS